MIVIVPYDAAWPARFATEAACLRREFGAAALRIEHVGSTSVPGLPAKPVIDIQVSVAALDPIDPFVAILQRLGYTHIPLGDFDRVYPFFQKPAIWPSTHHVHLCAAGSEQERRHLAFRDYLRAHPDVAAEYAAIKRSLAAAAAGREATLATREKYSLAKSPFVESVLARAYAAGFPSPASPGA